jgi:hypothetical protein
MIIVLDPAHRGCPPETSRRRSGMRCPAGRLVTGSREVPEPRPPPLRADAVSAFTRVFDALCELADGDAEDARVEEAPRAGPEAINPAVERREACVRRYRARGRAIPPCGPASWVRERVPMHPLRLSALRPLAGGNGNYASLGGSYASREG